MSNSIYEKNMEYIKKSSSRIYDYIEHKINAYKSGEQTEPEKGEDRTFDEHGMFEDIDIKTESAVDGTPVFKICKDGKEMYLNGKRNPGKIAEVWSKKFDQLPKTTPIIMFGIGNGEFLKVVSRKTRKDVRIFVYEPSLKIFIKCMETVDLSEVFEKREVFFGIENCHSYIELQDLIDGIASIENMEYMRTYLLPGYHHLYPQEATIFFNKAQRKLDEIISNIATHVFFADVAMPTLLRNAAYLPDCNTAFQLVDIIPRDMPAIVVAAGPSLDKNIKDLKAAKNKAFIIATDTAMKPLIRNGIIPDVFAVVDGKKPVELVMVPEAKKIPLLASVIASKDVLDYHEGKKFFFDEGYRFVWRHFTNNGIEFPTLEKGGSVATTCFSLAYVLGIDNVILIGQDLAYTNNQYHAKGTFEKDFEVKLDRCVMVPGNVEDFVPSPPDYKKYLDFYEYFIKGAKEHRKNFNVINATEGGARIEGTEVITLKEAIEKYCTKEFNYSEAINNLEPVFDTAARANVVEYLKGVSGELHGISEKSREMIEMYKKIGDMASCGKAKSKAYVKLLKKLEKRMKETLRLPSYDLIDSCLVSAHLILRSELLLDIDSVIEEGKELSRKGLIYWDLVSQCAELLAGVAAERLSNIE